MMHPDYAQPQPQTVVDGLSPLGGSGSTLSPGSPATGAAIAGSHTGPGSSFLANTGSFLEKLVSGLAKAPIPGNIGGFLANQFAERNGTGSSANSGKAKTTSATPPATPPTATGPATAKPLIDPMAMKLFFSTIIGPYLDSIVQEQNASADQLGSQMQHALNDFSIPDNVRGLLTADSAQAQADIRNVAQTQRAEAASAPDLAAFMAQLQSAQSAQEQARLEQQRVLSAQAVASGTVDPSIQAIIDSLGGSTATPTTTPSK